MQPRFPSSSRIASLFIQAMKEGINPGVQTFVSPQSEKNLPTNTDKVKDVALPLPGSASPGGAGRDIPKFEYNTPDSGSDIQPRSSALPGDQAGSPTKFDYNMPTRRSMTARIVQAWEAGLPSSTHQKNQDSQTKYEEQQRYKKNKSKEKSQAKRRYQDFCTHNQNCMNKREEYREAPWKYKRKGINRKAFDFNSLQIEEEDLQDYPESTPLKDLEKEHKKEISHFKSSLIGTDAVRAIEISRKIKEGWAGVKTFNVCELSKGFCRENKGLTRDLMPQIEDSHSAKELLSSDDEFKLAKGEAIVSYGGDPESKDTILDLFLKHLKSSGVSIFEEQVSVGSLRATQAEIKADKILGMVENYLKGDFPSITDPIVVSVDGFILDGHHRWAALLTLNPDREMKVKVVGLPMDRLLEEASVFPGVYSATFDGKPIIKTARQHKTRGVARAKAKAYYRQHKNQIKAKAKVWRRSHKAQIRRTQKIYHRNPSAHHRIAFTEVVSDNTIDFTIGDQNYPAVVDCITDTGFVHFTLSTEDDILEGSLHFDDFVETTVFVTLDDREMFFNLLDAALEGVEKLSADTFVYDVGSPASNEIKQPGEDVAYKATSPSHYTLAPDEQKGVPPGHDIPHGHADQMSPASSRVTPGGEGVMWSGDATYMKAATTIPEIFAKLEQGLLSSAKTIPVKLVRVSPKRNAWTFSATGSKGDAYTVKVKAVAPQGKPNIKDVGKSDIQISCNCKFWQYQGPEHWAFSQKYLLGQPVGTASKPDVKDPTGNKWLCKHAIAVLEKTRGYKLASNQNLFWNREAAVYQGNLGAVEMMKFYEKGTLRERTLMDRLLDADNLKAAWKLLEKVTGVDMIDPKTFKSASASRVASSYRKITAGACLQVKGADRLRYLDRVWDMFVGTYRSIGLILSAPNEMLSEFPVWELCFGTDGEPVAFSVYKPTPFGLKSGLSGSDGSPEGKRFSVQNIREKMHRPGYYGEASHKVAEIAIASGAPAICSIYASKILGKPVIMEEDGLHYSRNISGVGKVTKILLGRPVGMPTTDPKNPSCPTPVESFSSRFAAEDNDSFDKLAHASCLLKEGLIP